MEEQPIEPVKSMDIAIQTEKRKISEKQKEALRKGREAHHARSRAYKELLLQKEKEIPPVTEVVNEPVPEPPKLRKQLAFI